MLSQKIEKWEKKLINKGIEQGIERGREEGKELYQKKTIFHMYKKKLSEREISDLSGIDLKKVKEVISQLKPKKH